ncbi:MAG: peptidyl-tRNA hydrolase Pth2 [Candidatus Thermoplasmatota archaeon]|jgi:PTH2 family peptidyl-tRNA hydrolase|nr:peptidyl-tRNA hydrolase Pth2 [Candidatus Thermoplasmatota archaeon]MDP7263929.1 peptidyl-tRNA hydrolase Pth2 [Candidatus Thermoplasmatota archaeon]
MKYKLVVAVRRDLGLSKGKTAVQVAHAAVSCALAAQKQYPKITEEWLGEGQRKVVVRVPGVKEIFELKRLASKMDIVNYVVADAGLTEVEPGTITCIGLGPDKESLLDPFTGELKLM